MVGEVYNYYVSGGRDFDFGDQQVDFFDYGFNALINFDFKTDAKQDYETIFFKYDIALDGLLKGISVVNYISSHDTGGPYDLNRENPFDAGTKLLLCPGGVQIYYWDESAPSLTVDAQGDATLRSFMNWEEQNQEGNKLILEHWQKLGTFRNEHLAIGSGKHNMISSAPFTFSRTLGQDEVVIALKTDIGKKIIKVNNIWSDGTKVKDHYSSVESVVADGFVSVDSPHDIVLSEVMQ